MVGGLAMAISEGLALRAFRWPRQIQINAFACWLHFISKQCIIMIVLILHKSMEFQCMPAWMFYIYSAKVPLVGVLELFGMTLALKSE